MSESDYGIPANVPESVRARIMAARLLQQSAGAQTGPYTSKAVVGLKALSGLLGGLQERQAMQDLQQGQAAGNQQLVALASALRNGSSPGAMAAGAPSTAAGAPPSGTALGTALRGGDAPSSPISTASQNAFIQSALPHAQAVAAQTGIDPRLIVAQAALESNYGKAAPGGNLFGIKATGGQPSTGPIGTKEAVGGTLTPTLASFAAYGSPEASFAGYGKLMSHDRYAGVRNGATLDDQLSALGKSGYATDPNYAAKVGAIARGISMPGQSGASTASADVPAANAQPVASSSLPPGVTPDMLSPGAPPSPFGAPPSPMAQQPATPDAAALAAALRGQAGSGPGATPLPATMQPSSPFGAMPQSMAQPQAAPPAGPMMAGAPPPSPQPSPFGGPPQAMQGQGGADPRMLAALLAKGGQGQPGAPSAPPLSPNALAMGDMMPGGPGPAALDPSAGAQPAAGLSSAQLPGMDNFSGAGDGSVRQTSIVDPSDPTATPGFTGSFGPGIQPQISGALPSPDMLAQGAGDMASPAPPSGAALAAALRGGASAPAAPGPMPPPAPGQPPAPIPAAPAAPAGPQTASLMPGAVDDFGRTPDQAMAGSPLPSIPDATTAAMAKAGYDTTGLPGAPPADPSSMSDFDPAKRALMAARNGAPPPQSTGLPDPNHQSPSVQAQMAQDARNGLLPTPASPGASPPPDLSGLANAAGSPPPGAGLPIMARQSSNPPAALQQDFAGLGQGQPQSSGPAPGAPAPSPSPAVPLPPPRPSDAALGLNPNAPAPGASPAGPAPLPPALAQAMMQQPMGLPGNSPTSDPSSAVNFNRQEALRAQAAGQSPASLLGSLLRGGPNGGTGTPAAAAAPQDAGVGGTGSPFDAISRLFGGGMGNSPIPAGQGGQGGQAGGNPLAGLPMVGGMFGGQGGQQPGVGPNGQAAGSSLYGGQGQGQQFAPGGQGQQPGQGGQGQAGGMAQAQAVAGQILSNPYAAPEARAEAAKVLFAQPSYQKLENGDLYRVDPFNQAPPQLVARGGKFEATKNGVIYNQGTGLGVDGQPIGGANSYRPMTPAELKAYGIGDGRPSYIGPGGEPHFGMPEAQGQGESAEAKTAGEAAANRRNDMLTGATAAPEKIARLSLLGTVLDRTQTGPLAGEAGTAAAVATRLGIAPERLAQLGVDPNQAVNNAIANKLAGEMTMGSIGAKNGGMPASNFSVAERQFIEALYPSIENQAGGNRAVTDVLTAVEQRKLQVADAWSSYKDQQTQAGKPLSYENFEDQFRRAHSQDNIFAPIIQKYQAGAYTPTVPTPGGVPGAVPAQGMPGMPQGGPPSAAAAPPQGQPGAGWVYDQGSNSIVNPSTGERRAIGAPQGQQGQQGGGYLPGAARGPASAPAQPAPSGGAMPPPAAVAALRGNPGLQGQFDAKYGPGASARALGR